MWSNGSVYQGFYAFSEWIYSQTESTWQISLERLSELIFRYLTGVLALEEKSIKAILIEDIMGERGRKLPSFLRDEYEPKESKEMTSKLNKRQLKHSKEEIHDKN